MVKALHKAGIEVILDVVFNHTTEGNHEGPTINFKGFDSSIYYHTVPSDRQYFMDYSGCGNTLNCNHPITEKMIVESLEYWVSEMHVDGFRFDEGSILARGQTGEVLAYPPVIWEIELSETLADSKIIAEAWDAAGLYQIGYFPGFRWAEWNGKFRDDIRRFLSGDGGVVGAVAKRISGSADLYQTSGHLPINSINFINCHDGFTLNDTVSYNEKHNADNGEGNNDGVNDNMSWNCGVEGPTDDPGIEALRNRQIKNAFAMLMLSRGVPMFVAGDEIRRTQRGNNNAHFRQCTTRSAGFDWSLQDKHADVLRFFQQMIAFRKRMSMVHKPRFFTGASNARGLKDLVWHGTILETPGWDDPNGRAVAFTMAGFGDDTDLHVMFNMHWDGLDFELPAVPGRQWAFRSRHRCSHARRHRRTGHGAIGERRHAPCGRPEHRCTHFAVAGNGTAVSRRSGRTMDVKNSLSDTTVGTGFAFSDTIAGYVSNVDADRNGFRLTTSDGREFPVRFSAACYAELAR